jgi:hypothetical protein
MSWKWILIVLTGLTSIIYAYQLKKVLFPQRSLSPCSAKITPTQVANPSFDCINRSLFITLMSLIKEFEDMDQYREAVLNVLKSQAIDRTKLGGRELLDLIIRKWGVAYDVQLRKNSPFGEGSSNIYINIMWRYYGQKSFPMNEKQYLEHLEAIGRYITAIGKVKVIIKNYIN